jgi:S-(hydroxymethyl)glutathione dehydrogenase/alcohol dehydrogenase
MYSMAGFADEVVVPASAVVRIETWLDLVAASILGCIVLTAYGAVANVARLRLGETVAVVAAGGVGLNIISLARAFGATQVIAVDVDADNLQKAAEVGASDVVNSRKDDPVAAINDLSDGGVDVVFEARGLPETFEIAISLVSDGG